MGSMKDTLGDAPYPHSPGWKEETTSREAAERMAPSANTLRAQALQVIRRSGLLGATADEVAAAMGESVLAIRPRVSELFKMGAIIASDGRRTNRSGMKAKVWRASPYFSGEV